MPKAKYAHRDKPKPKAIKSKGPLSSKRKLSRFGKKQQKGHAGEMSFYITRTRAIKRLQVSLRDFRRLCILKGIYPREPKHKKAGDTQTYYHVKDIAYLAHEPLLDKFRQLKTFLKRVTKVLHKNNLSEARRMYAATVQTLGIGIGGTLAESSPALSSPDGSSPGLSSPPLSSPAALAHLIKERYPTFDSALGDLDDALSMTHLFASLPALFSIKTGRTAAAKRLVVEWQHYVARTRSLRKVFLSVKGVYFQADVRGSPVTWLQPWNFAQTIPSDVDYRVMSTFMDLYDALLKFVLFKLYNNIGLAYPPKIRTEVEAAGGHLTALQFDAAQDETGETDKKTTVDADASKRLASLKDKLKTITATSGATVAATAPAARAPSKKAAARKSASSAMYDFVDIEEDDADQELKELQEFGESEEGKKLLEQARKLRMFSNLFQGLVFFLNREVPREMFEFIICSFRGRVGWDGPGSPYEVNDPRITHHIVDRPMPVGTLVGGREYIQPQWVADSINARMLLPVAKYAPGASLPPHLSPFVNDTEEGYVPAYRHELDRLRAAAAVTGRLADVVTDDAAPTSRIGADADDEEADSDDDDDGAEAPIRPAKRARREAEADEDEDEDEEDGEDDEEDDEEEQEGSDLDEEEVAAALRNPTTKYGRDSKPAFDLIKAENERKALAISMLTNKKRKTYERVMASVGHKKARVASLEEKAKAAAKRGDVGVGAAAHTVVSTPAAAAGAGKAPIAGDKRPRSKR